MNMLSNRTNRFKTNILNKKTRRFSEVEYNNVELLNDYSVSDDDLYFTNFLSETGHNTMKNRFKTVYNDIVVNPKNIDNYFEGTELYSAVSNQRLIDIINLYNMNLTVCDVTNILKYKSRDSDKGFQLYIKKDNNILEIVLVDFFHLGIPSEFQKIRGGHIKANPQRVYLKNANNKYCLSQLINESILVETN